MPQQQFVMIAVDVVVSLHIVGVSGLLGKAQDCWTEGLAPCWSYQWRVLTSYIVRLRKHMNCCVEFAFELFAEDGFSTSILGYLVNSIRSPNIRSDELCSYSQLLTSGGPKTL
jgi:hypothetical protein